MTHIFRPNELFAQIIVIPEEANFELEAMNEEESAGAVSQARRIYANRRNCRSNRMDILNRHGFRRHLSPPASRAAQVAQRMTSGRSATHRLQDTGPRRPCLKCFPCPTAAFSISRR